MCVVHFTFPAVLAIVLPPVDRCVDQTTSHPYRQYWNEFRPVRRGLKRGVTL